MTVEVDKLIARLDQCIRAECQGYGYVTLYARGLAYARYVVQEEAKREADEKKEVI